MTTEKNNEKRKSFRLPFNAEVSCCIEPNGEMYTGKMHDISSDGFFMETDNCPTIGSKCDIKIILEGVNSRLIIDKLDGNVIRKTAEGVSIRFDNKLEWLALVPIYFQKIRDNG